MSGCRLRQVETDLYPASLQLTSPAFEEDGEIPHTYTCTGGGLTPPLSWGNTPVGTKSLALLLVRIAEPDEAGQWPEGAVHWILFNIPPEATSLPETNRLHAPVEGSVSGTNDFGVAGYDGPCPPKGELSRYAFHVYALNDQLHLDSGAGVMDVLSAIEGRTLAHGRLSLRFGYETN